jgi:serine/threonine-protein kinase HipA
MADRHVETIVRIDDTDVLAGELWSHRRKGRESATFSYATSYLETAGAYALDPALPLVAGQQQTAAGRALFGAFTDCAPDRWGRRLIARAEKHHAEDSREAERSLGEIDFLLGGRDDMRQGALRFRDPETGAFLTDDGSGVPALIGLPRLLAASERV